MLSEKLIFILLLAAVATAIPRKFIFTHIFIDSVIF